MSEIHSLAQRNLRAIVRGEPLESPIGISELDAVGWSRATCFLVSP
jgi:hypothetical protein